MKKMVKKFVFAAMALTMLVGVHAVSAYAMEDGVYTVQTRVFYRNPDTGKIDDGGSGNEELGEGMCRSVVFEKALLEQKGGETTVTMKVLLYSNMSNIRIAVQDAPKGSYTDAKYTVVKESSSTNSADIKFSVPAADSYIQMKMYVGPMGRDVCFYWNCDPSTAVAGTDSFKITEAPSAPETAADRLKDIDNHWAESAIRFAVNNKLFSGTTDTTFSPDGTMTRGMFVTVLGRMSGEEISGTNHAFQDVKATQYYAPYVAWASKNGIVSGTSKTAFAPNASVTCEQAASILTKYAAYKGITLGTKSISPSTTGVSGWAKDAVMQAGKAGIITKQNTNGYNYTSAATRADVASMLNNFYTYYGK